MQVCVSFLQGGVTSTLYGILHKILNIPSLSYTFRKRFVLGQDHSVINLLSFHLILMDRILRLRLQDVYLTVYISLKVSDQGAGIIYQF